MPTYAQLEAETWWRREKTTPELEWLFAQISLALKIPKINVGSKGDNLHLNGSHRSQEWILNSRYCTNRSYTVQSGLTAEQARHLAGVDITPASRADMLAISRNIDKATRSGRLEEVREWYGNTNDDQRVDGWNNVRDAVVTSGSSHLWHLHLTLDRRVLTDMAVMQKILAALLGRETEGDDMAWDDVTAILHGSTSLGWVDKTAPEWVRDKAKYNLAALHAKVDALLGRPVLVVDANTAGAIADMVAEKLINDKDIPVGSDLKETVKAAVAEVFRESFEEVPA